MKKKNKKTDWEFFDDCEICKAMKEGKASTHEDLMEVFRKQKLKQNDQEISSVSYNAGEALDAMKVEKWFKKESKKFPKEFKQTLKEWKKFND